MDGQVAVIIGSCTWGSTGQPYYYEFTNGMSIRISTKRAYFPDGSPFEGIGIKPDIVAALSREDVYEHRDAVLEAAIHMAAQ